MVHRKCQNCGSYYSADQNTCPNCGENRLYPSVNDETNGISSVSASSNTMKYIGVFLVALILMGGGYYFLCNSSTESITVEVTDWEYETSFGVYSIEVTTEFVYSGALAITLSERELTLYINEMNLGTIGFSESWEKFDPGWSATYTGTYITTDEEDIDELTSVATYNLNLKFKAKAKVGIVNKYIEIREEATSAVQHQ